MKVATGATRDGEAVTKTRLEPNEDAPVVSRYLKLRASGVSRKRALEQLDLPMAKTSAIGLEWNALTYAGHTVWNVHKDFLSNLIDNVTLDPVSHDCRINYRISMDLRNKVASPRGVEPLLPP